MTQPDLFDQPGAQSTGERQTDLEDMIHERSQTKLRGTNSQEYEIYLACADDGNGGDITNGGAPLKTFDEWMNS